MNRVAVFIDGTNIFHCAKQLGFEVDYDFLLQHLLKQTKDPQLVRAFYYTGIDESAERQRGFLHWMRRNGFRVITKPLKVDKDGIRRASMEVELVTDLMEFVDKVDTLILVTGNEDFAYPLQALLRKSVKVVVAGFKNSTSNKILDLADQWIELDSSVQGDKKRTYDGPEFKFTGVKGDEELSFRSRI